VEGAGCKEFYFTRKQHTRSAIAQGKLCHHNGTRLPIGSFALIGASANLGL